MADWIETYRGVVNAWECDVVEHFTIAYYFDRFADASRNFLDLIGEGESLQPAVNEGLGVYSPNADGPIVHCGRFPGPVWSAYSVPSAGSSCWARIRSEGVRFALTDADSMILLVSLIHQNCLFRTNIRKFGSFLPIL